MLFFSLQINFNTKRGPWIHYESLVLLFYFIGKTASGALLNEKGPRGGGHENGTVVKLEDIKTFCSPIVIIVIEFM